LGSVVWPQPRDEHPSSRPLAESGAPNEASGQQLAPSTSVTPLCRPGDGVLALSASASLAWTKAKHVASDSHRAQHAPRLSTFAPLAKLTEREAEVTSVCAAGAEQLGSCTSAKLRAEPAVVLP
jgi:hypothetical protein